MEKATFAAGCFWGVELKFSKIYGILSTSVGYMGGLLDNPTYKDVCTNTSGHAEVVEIIYDPERVNYDTLLDVFWKIHDPTQLNRQGLDVGSQYRSVIFFHSSDQQDTALKSLERLQNSEKFKNKKIVTQIVPAATFYRAEEYHQKYLEKKGVSCCRI